VLLFLSISSSIADVTYTTVPTDNARQSNMHVVNDCAGTGRLIASLRARDPTFMYSGRPVPCFVRELVRGSSNLLSGSATANRIICTDLFVALSIVKARCQLLTEIVCNSLTSGSSEAEDARRRVPPFQTEFLIQQAGEV